MAIVKGQQKHKVAIYFILTVGALRVPHPLWVR